MTFPRKLGLLLVAIAALATAGHFLELSLPSLRWFYSFEADPDAVVDQPHLAHQARVVGLALSGVMALLGLALIVLGGGFHWNPLTLRKMERFRSIGRGHRSYRILLVLVALALLDQALVGRRALAVRHEGRWSFPAFQQRLFTEVDFGGDSRQEVDFRALRERFRSEQTGDLVILAPIPWDPTFDSDGEFRRELPMVDGEVRTHNHRKLYSGTAVCFVDDDRDLKVRDATIRQGKLDGPARVFDENGEIVGREVWKDGERVSTTAPEDFEVPECGGWMEVIYPPAPPSLAKGWSKLHLLGTDSQGWDIAAQLFGGLQVVFKGAVLYVLLTYGLGITIGCLMGYFGGTFDLVMQRVMEVMSNVPFLLVVMIITNSIGRENISLTKILLVFCVFSWIGIAIYLRTASYKEKAREYASAARVLGAGTGRIIFRHILPNAISTIVTLLPFSIASVVASLTALDFLGFGVPDSYPSWGRVLNDGTVHLESPWIVSSVFGVMVLLLLLITFVGEAVREAFDPRKFTTYQ